MFDLWGPLYQGVPGGGDDVELVVDAQPVLSGVTITRGELSADSRRRTYVLRAGKSVGKVTVRAQDQRNSVWSTFDVDIRRNTSPSLARRYTREHLRTGPGRIGWPGWQGACPNTPTGSGLAK